jgi:siroheme synthase
VRCIAVPGVSALNAVPLAAGIPLTCRGVAKELVVRSGHPSRCGVDEEGPRDSEAGGTTYVYFMAVSRLAAVASELLAEGLDPATPAALIQCGTMPGEKVVTASLETIARAAGDHAIEPPALLVVGDVVRLREARAAAPPSGSAPAGASRSAQGGAGAEPPAPEARLQPVEARWRE